MEESQATSRETVRVLAALSDENRFRIVELLATEKQELTCGAISKALDMSPSLLSHHLGILADADIIGRRKNGLWTMNVLQQSVIERQVKTLQSLIRSGTGHSESVIRLHRAGADPDDAAPKPHANGASPRSNGGGSRGAGSRGDEAVAGS